MKNIFQIKFILFFLFYFNVLAFNVFAQSNTQSLLKTEIVPPSPNAASLGKYIDLPVGLYTGTPNTSIPITEISAGSFSLPITLSYHASGLKVEEIASWVGAGWSLNAGGTITRQVRGRKDDNAGGYFYGGASNLFFDSTDPQYQLNRNKLIAYINDANLISQTLNGTLGTVESMVKGCEDTEPDVFSYTLPNESGKFIFNKQIIPTFFPKKNITLTKHIFQSNNYGWEMKDEMGNTYIGILNHL